MKLFKTMLYFVLAALLVESLATNLAAQSFVSGQVDGTVTDPAGAVVPDAKVNLSSSRPVLTATQQRVRKVPSISRLSNPAPIR